MLEENIIKESKSEIRWGKMSAAFLLIAVASALSIFVMQPG